jgi:hypothetical protein
VIEMPQTPPQSSSTAPAGNDAAPQDKRKAVEDLISGGHLSSAEDKVQPPAQTPADPAEPGGE